MSTAEPERVACGSTAFHGCHHFQWCGVDLAYNGHRLGTCAEPPLEVVPPILAVDPGVSGSGCALDGGAGLACRRWSRARMSTAEPERVACESTAFHGCHGFQPCRSTTAHGPARGTTGSGGTHGDCRLGRRSLGLRPRRRSRSGLRASRQPSTGATASSRAGVRRRTDSHEAPLEVVAPMGTVDSGVDRSGFALDGEAGAGCVQGDSLPRVPRLLAVRSTTARGPARGPRLYCPNRSCFVAFPRDSSTG
jgi:hypothetical protein